ncbi:hypothetical protein CEXT_243271 [Caerostris extrusa]|uniref:Uncharacterized protein n=1 Tax=Caerostris extrusa TaxID=172846 RepID=A0AAV4YF41_CAEEX|nr:hypothetical protein CEXT_243271 [Caerostris extrusa]
MCTKELMSQSLRTLQNYSFCKGRFFSYCDRNTHLSSQEVAFQKGAREHTLTNFLRSCNGQRRIMVVNFANINRRKQCPLFNKPSSPTGNEPSISDQGDNTASDPS